MKIQDAKNAEKKILTISQDLNKAIRDAAEIGIIVEIDTYPLYLNGSAHARIDVSVKVRPNEIDSLTEGSTDG